MSLIETHRLSSGIRVVYIHHAECEVTHCSLLIQSGSRDEPKGKEGLAHFIEHNLFKGTKKRKAYHILNRLEVVGGELNAYTTKEETCLHASIMNQHVERAIDLIADIMYNSVFPPKEIEKEKDVILDEIKSYQDAPYEQIFDDFEEQLFAGHTLSHPILGYEDSLKKFKQKDLIDFIQSTYLSNKIVIAVNSNIGLLKTINLLEKYFVGDIAKLKKSKLNSNRHPFQGYKAKQVRVIKPVNQYHFIQGCPAYSYSHKDRMPLVLFNNLLGGQGMNSKLNLNIREKYGVTYTIESGYQAYSDSGIFHVYFATEAKNFEKTQRLLEKELDRILEKGISKQQFKLYKEQFIGQITLSQESRLSVMLAISKGLLYFDKVISRDELKARINNVDLDSVNRVARHVLNPKRMSSLVYQPL